MNTAIIDPLVDRRWDVFVEKHPMSWICHLSGWKKVLEKSFNHMRGHYLVLLSNGGIKAALPLFEVRSRITGNRLVSIPFATLFDPLVSGRDEMDELLESAVSLSRRLKTSYIEIRAFSSSSVVRDERFGVQRFYKHHYLDLDTDLEGVRKTFDRTCVRQRISRGQKSGLRVRAGEQESDLLLFYSLYVKNRKRLGLPPQPYLFFRMLREVFLPTKNIEILLAEFGGMAIAGVILFKFRNRVSIEFSVHDHAYRNMSAVPFLFWEAIKSSYREGYEILDFGRTSPANKGLMDFKRRWGTKVTDIPHFYCPPSASHGRGNRESSILTRAVKVICNKAPEFILPGFGRLCYRHLG
ncbi:MAG: GNAT family N-acetyltransferase [DPANN group archaeon]|nr:GNAT family N-acetyltransferase [DPANN group archaeon]